MPLSKSPIKKIAIPAGVQLDVENNIYKFKGPKGEASKKLISPEIKITKQDNTLVLESAVKKPTRTEKDLINTFTSHIKNLITGVQDGYTYKLKVCASHFPITVTVDKDEVVVKNFLGEKIPRKSKILAGAKVKVEGDVITIEGADLENVSQTAANIEIATRIVNRDRRKFQDGIYITEKAGVKL